MISEAADLLQANATMIAGILIFLTIARISKGGVAQIKEKRAILLSTYTTLLYCL